MAKYLRKVISGGQTGSDIAGLHAAQACGLETGGWMPKYFRTLDGNKPQMAEMFDIKEHSSASYKDRMWDNVREADATIRIAAKFNSAGEKCTLKAIQALDKPYIDVDINKPLPIMDVVKWLRKHKVKVLNVAGNSEKTSPGIEEQARDYLIEVLKHFELE